MTNDIRICFVGDSFVNGTGDETALGWAGRLCAAAATQGHLVTYYNLGIRRNTSREVMRRWQQECALRLPDACDARIVFSFGVNDAAIEGENLRIPFEESVSNLRTLLGDAKKYKVLMVGPPPIADDQLNQRIATLSTAYACEATALGIPFIDVFPALVADLEYQREVSDNDGAHPRSGGYTKLAAIIGRSTHWWWPVGRVVTE